MFFRRKKECENCGEKVSKKYSFCPYCGDELFDEDEGEEEDYGLLGKNDSTSQKDNLFPEFGIMDKMMGSIMNNMMKNLSKQFKGNIGRANFQENARVEHFPNGVKISIGMPAKKEQKPAQAPKKEITKEQMERISKFPRAKAKTKITRLADKIIYELDVPGISTPEDVFISKLESGYEIKAIGKNKIYTSTIPTSNSIYGFGIKDNTLFVEFRMK